MMILKAKDFTKAADIATFVNVNKINREDIVQITDTIVTGNLHQITIFFFADSEKEEITRGFFGWKD